MVTTLITGLLLGGNRPAWVPHDLAGYTIGFGKESSQIKRRDAKSGMWIGRMIECDGAHVSLVLTRDIKMIHVEDGWDPDSNKPTKFRYLGTDRGALIGMTEAQISAKIGKAPKRKIDGPYVRTSYEWKNLKNGEGHIYSQELVFKGGKLIEISVNREAIPGC